ncbi:MAG: hypothetical protein HQL01_08950 [Nitrospirae bacterium]|nr:hypothetical protein [Nitrospirota bacterium]
MDKDMYNKINKAGNGRKKVLKAPECDSAECEIGLAVAENDTEPVVSQSDPVPAPPKTAKLNCWEFKQCGRQPGGVNAEALGICPVTIATSYDGLHDGKNAGRSCWAVPFATTDGKMSFASKIRKCTKCEFHHLVISQEEKYQSALKHLKKFNKEEKAKLFKERKTEIFKEPSLVRHIFEKSKHTAYGEDAEVDSLFITLLIGWVSLCPSVSFLEGSKRICKDDLVDELMVIDAIADNPRRRAAKTVAKTMLKAVGKQISRYFDPLVDIVKKKAAK